MSVATLLFGQKIRTKNLKCNANQQDYNIVDNTNERLQELRRSRVRCIEYFAPTNSYAGEVEYFKASQAKFWGRERVWKITDNRMYMRAKKIKVRYSLHGCTTQCGLSVVLSYKETVVQRAWKASFVTFPQVWDFSGSNFVHCDS